MHRIIDLSAVLAGFLVERLREAGIAAATSAGHDAESERWVVTGVPNASTVYIAKSDDIERAVAITHAFMAEQGSSANAWLLGALASAVAGVALLATSRTRRTVTTVPV